MKMPLVVFLAIGLVGCGKKIDHSADGEVGHEAHEAGAEGARYAEGKGIILLAETKKAIGLQLQEAEERKLVPVVRIEAQVYRGAGEPSRPGAEQSGSAYATAFVDALAAGKLKAGDQAGLIAGGIEYSGRVWRMDASSSQAVSSAEAILEIPDPRKMLRVGDFVAGQVTESHTESEVITVPRSAVLETSVGKFAFVQNGDFLLRTPVSTGAESADYIEITDGLYAGDVVASQAAETLYLIELRATKGGGHCH